MANFISPSAPHHWYPRPGERVEGMSSGRLVQGVVEESYKHPGRPAVFSRYGFVGLYIRTDSGRRVAINEVRPVAGSDKPQAVSAHPSVPGVEAWTR